MKKKIAFCGIGQCGGSVISEAEKKGFITGAMNTSPEDLDSVSMRIINNKLLLGKNGGCGKDRKIAKNDVKKYHTEIVEFIKTNFIKPNPNLELIYLVFSSSGGTGSGMGPIIIDLLKKFFNKKDYPKLEFGAIVITPSDDESPIAIFNSRQCLEELYKLNIPIMLPDNDKYKNLNTTNSRKNLYNKVNEDIIMAFEEVCLNRGSSDISNMDIKDKLKLIKTPGITVITATEIMPSDMIDDTTMAKAIQDSWNSSVFVNLDYDKVVKRVGYIFEIPEKLTRIINHQTINRDLGMPMEIFEGIYKINEHPRVISILTGLSFPSNKIKSIDETLEKVQGIVKKEEKKDIFGKSNIKNLFDEDDIEENDEDDSVDLESLFSNY